MISTNKPINHFGIICYLILVGITLIVIQFHLFARFINPDYSSYFSNLINTVITVIVSAGIALWLVDYTNERSQYLNRLEFFKNLFSELKNNERKFNELPSILIQLKNTWERCEIDNFNEWIQPKSAKIKPFYYGPYYSWEYLSTRVYNVLIQKGYYSIIKGFSLDDEEKILDALKNCYSICENLNNSNQDIENIAVTAIKWYTKYQINDKSVKLTIRYISKFKGVQILGVTEPGDTYSFVFLKEDGSTFSPSIIKMPKSLRNLPENLVFVANLQELLDQCINDLNNSYLEAREELSSFPGTNKENENEFFQYIDRTHEEPNGILAFFFKYRKGIQPIILSFSIVAILYVIFNDYNKIPNLLNHSSILLVIICGILIVYFTLFWSKRCKMD